MAERYPQTTVLQFQHGFATDLSHQTRELRNFTRAENVMFEISGAVRKVGGRIRLNTSAIASSANIVGMYDFWRTTGGADKQHFVAIAGDGTIHNLGADITASAITGSAVVGTDVIPVFAQLNDVLTMWFDDNSTPLQWEGAGNVATLAAPVGRGAIRHVNRLFSWGTLGDPSRLHWSALGDPTRWSGSSDTGSIFVDISDGDRIVSLVSYKDRLFIFKGPNKGSIHMLSGRTPSDFSLIKLVEGISVQGPNAAVHVQDDVWYMAQDGIYSLAATEKFGNFEQSRLTRLLDTFFRDTIYRKQLARVSAIDYRAKSCALWCIRTAGQAEFQDVLGISYVRADVGGLQPFRWTGRSCWSSAIRINAALRAAREVVFGQTDGFITRHDTEDRNLDGSTAYTGRVTTPALILSPGNPRGDQPVELRRMWLRARPLGSYDITVNLTRDEVSSEAYTFNMGAITETGFTLGTDALGTGALGSGVDPQMRVLHQPLVGETRGVIVDIQQAGADQDFDIYELGIEYLPIGTSYTTSLTATE